MLSRRFRFRGRSGNPINTNEQIGLHGVLSELQNVEKHTCEEKNTCRQDVDLYKSTSGTTSVRKGATPVAKTGGGRKRGGERPESPHQEATHQATAEQPNGRTGEREARERRAGGADGREETPGRRAGGRKSNSKSIQCYPPRPVRSWTAIG